MGTPFALFLFRTKTHSGHYGVPGTKPWGVPPTGGAAACGVNPTTTKADNIFSWAHYGGVGQLEVRFCSGKRVFGFVLWILIIGLEWEKLKWLNMVFWKWVLEFWVLVCIWFSENQSWTLKIGLSINFGKSICDFQILDWLSFFWNDSLMEDLYELYFEKNFKVRFYATDVNLKLDFIFK